MVDELKNEPSTSNSYEFLIKKDDECIFVDELAPFSFAVFNEDDIQVLKEKYRIIGDSLDRPETANTIEVPLLLLSEQVQVLLEQGFIKVRRIKYFDEIADSMVQVAKPVNGVEETEIIRRAKLMIVGRKIKEQKRKYVGEDAPSAQKRTRVNDMKIEEMEIPTEELSIAVKELTDKYVKKNVDTVSTSIPYYPLESAYEIVSTVEFPDDPEYRQRVTVFRDLWRKGFYLSPGTKFGCHFLAYEKPRGETHSKYMVICAASSEKIALLDIISVSRVASQVKKEVLLATVASDSVIPYYTKINWWKGSSD